MEKIRQSIIAALLKNKVIASPDEIVDMRPADSGITNHSYLIQTPKLSLFCKYAPGKPQGIAVAGAVENRLEIEAKAIDLLKRLNLNPANFPEVIFYDATFSVLALKQVPTGSRLLSDDLMAGKVDRTISSKMGEILASIHNASLNNPVAAHVLLGTDALEKVRIPASYQNISPLPEIQKKADVLADELIRNKTCIVHCDYKPNNLFVCPNGKLMVIDWEFAHYGDPAFDCGFLMGIYLHFAMVNPKKYERYLTAIEDYWRAYADNSAVKNINELEKRALMHAGVSILARLDGALKFPSSQNEQARNTLRPLGQKMVMGNIRKVNNIRKSFKVS
ncbi:MAG: aminoglycoside phosphotransferase family protein [Candidatus Peregrinibacteria bacterium]